MAIEDNINDEISFLNKISAELNELHDRCRDIVQTENKYSNGTLLPVLISRIASMTELFEEKYNSLCSIIAKTHKITNLHVSTIADSGKKDNSILNLTCHRKVQIFSEQLTNYKYLLAKLFRDSREVKSFEMCYRDTYSKFKNRKLADSNNDLSTLHTTNRELRDTLSQGINTVKLLSTQNKRLSGIKNNLIGLLRLVSVSDSTIVSIHKYARMNQHIITLGFIMAFVFIFFIYYYF
ncbi:hypothetical protein BMR1_02g00060 [Babesia microti strain RI]|uniref:Golgi SNAP receptor complex member 2 n=1 Tax=Babesia microti (strain RI) TaxID=1133968 RepID=I7I8H3_BABMR|nr:hypothetical protein BMR1_02g00060 [Babesia microti strain RI]CCF73178.1 hypothetical protein BMR1_02g00060 [Babesia microti strain RI]|eukprot:XP_012647787.1 hypothetical protein BMR1_02g00060 [Babesia microti strain RI]